VEEIDLGASIVKETEAIRPECEARGLALELELGPEPRLALGDRRRVEQVLRHLLSNALKFTEEGGIGIALAIGAEGAVVAIRDSGRGIDAKDLERIWTPFRQLDEGHARAYEGMGIGLSLSRLILAAMGGSIAVESRPGEGSTFSVELPLYLGPR
jgi:signal transduction histidine kinase